jgi:hypothetical protein
MVREERDTESCHPTETSYVCSKVIAGGEDRRPREGKRAKEKRREGEAI